MMRSVDVGVQRRKLVFKGIGDKALRREMVALVGLHGLKHPVNARQTFERRRMQMQPVLDVQNSPEPMLGIFNGDASNNAMDLIAFFQQQLSEVRSILSGNAGN